MVSLSWVYTVDFDIDLLATDDFCLHYIDLSVFISEQIRLMEPLLQILLKYYFGADGHTGECP